MSAAEAEASGQEYVDAAFGGTTFRVPLDVDSWPLDAVRGSRAAHRVKKKIVVHPSGLLAALQLLLGAEQWPAFLTAAPRRKDHAAASHVFAAAVGIPANPDFADHDVVFGGIPRLLAMLDTWPDKVESDLGQFWNLDYRDRWRRDDVGRRRLTLRQIYARVSNLRPEMALAVALQRRSPTDLLLMDLYEAVTRTRHPSRPMSAKQIAEREAQAAAEDKARRQYRERQARRTAELSPTKSAALTNARTNARRLQQKEA